MVDLSVKFNPTDKRLIIEPSSLQFQKSLVMISGEVGGVAGLLKLNIHAGQLDYVEGLNIITKALREKLHMIQFKEPISLDVSLDGFLAGGEPKVLVRFSGEKNQLKWSKYTVNDFSFAGSFMNHMDTTRDFDDPNSSLTLQNFSGIVEKFPVEGSLTITNLEVPYISLQSKSNFSLGRLNQYSDTTQRKFLRGAFLMKVSYEGLLMDYFHPSTTSYTGKLRGDIILKNGELQEIAHQKKISRAA